jgi:hypothetical protein
MVRCDAEILTLWMPVEPSWAGLDVSFHSGRQKKRALHGAHATARGGSAPPLIREGRRPAKTGHRICGDASVGLAWAAHTRFLRDGECRVAV